MSVRLDRYVQRALKEMVAAEVSRITAAGAGGNGTGGAGVGGGAVAAAQITQTAQQQFVSADQVARWEAGSGQVTNVFPLTNITGSVLIHHGFDSEDVFGEIRTATGAPEPNVFAEVPKDLPPAVYRNNLRVRVPAGDPPFSGKLIATYVPPI